MKRNKIELARMSACGSCVVDFVANPMPNVFPTTGTKSLILGGVGGFAFIDKNLAFTNVASPTEWAAGIAADKIRGFNNGCRIKGSLPAPERTTRKVGSCGTEETTKREQKVSFQLYEFDEDFDVYDLFQWLETSDRWQCMSVAFFTCSDSKNNDRQLALNFNSTTTKFGTLKSFDAYEIIEDTDDGSFYIQVDMTVDYTIKKPVDITTVLSSSTVNLNG
jgi:hypothetical protein